MTTKQIIAAMTSQDTGDQDDLIAALRNADDDGIRSLLEKIRVAVRNDTVTDILADLKSEGETDAYGLIRENY